MLCAHGDPPCPENETAVKEFAEQRRHASADIRDGDRWHSVFFDTSAVVPRFREGYGRARQHDPTLGVFSSIEVAGPAGLVADEPARRHYFGKDLS